MRVASFPFSRGEGLTRLIASRVELDWQWVAEVGKTNVGRHDSWLREGIVSVSSTIFHVFYASAFLILHNSSNCQALIHRNFFFLYFCDYATSAVRHKTNFKQLLKQCCTAKRSKLSFVQSKLFLCFFYFFERIPARRCRDGKYLQTMNHCDGHNVASFNWDELSLRDRNSWDSSTSRRRGFTVTHGKKNDLCKRQIHN